MIVRISTYSNSPDYDNYDPFTMEIRFWQVRAVAWIGAYSGFLMGVTHGERPAFAAISWFSIPNVVVYFY